MKAIAKVLAPAALAFAAFSANAAGVLETDYPAQAGHAAVAAPASGSAATGAREMLNWPISEAAPVVHSIDAAQTHSARDAMRKAADQPLFDTRYFA